MVAPPPEMLLQTLLCSAHEGDRTFAVQKVLDIRAMDAERSPVRTRHKVTLNKDATCLQILIVWGPMKTNEPVLTKQLSEEDLKDIVQTPMEVGCCPVHGQGVERCVKDVTAALDAVFGQDRRAGFVMARLAHRQKTGGAVKSKKNHAMICTRELTAPCEKAWRTGTGTGTGT